MTVENNDNDGYKSNRSTAESDPEWRECGVMNALALLVFAGRPKPGTRAGVHSP